MQSLAVILPAAGSSSRFGAGVNKLLAPLGGTPVLARSLQAFLHRDDVKLVVIAGREEDGFGIEAEPLLLQLLEDPRVRTCPGGPSRAHSVRNALAEVPASIEWVAVHDAARPLVSRALVDRTLEVAYARGAAVPAVGLVPTVKQATGPLPAKVQQTVPRQSLWAVQTPQVARRAALESAFASCPVPLESVTDESQLLELAGQEVWLVPGDERNIKITTPDDLAAAHLFLSHPAEARR